MANALEKALSFGEGKELKGYWKLVKKINEHEPEMEKLKDEDFPKLTEKLKKRLKDGETLDDVLVEAFAAVREAAKRTIGQRHFDVQLIGAMVLNDGKIAEMKTGEGKTLVATAAVYLNALTGEGVHVVTVNDYLAGRDSIWMGRIYKFLGLKVGLIQTEMTPDERKPAYAADVTYGTNSEFGFDYLRDNMVTLGADRVQRGHAYAIVDEVDSILIDEARTPLIISGAGEKSASLYRDFARVMPRLIEDEDYELDEAKHTCAPTEDGITKVERMLNIKDIYGDPSGQLANHLKQALSAQYLFHRDQQYMVRDGEVLIVDEFTGRVLPGRRYSEGLHQAIEAKENVTVREENQTLATITLQNYFRMYDKLSGMTGTAVTEDKEFRDIYELPVVVIPTNMPMVRDDRHDLVYRTVEAKYDAVADFIKERHAEGQPCLVGTISIEHSEHLSQLLNDRGIKHSILNAKQHEKEAWIVAQAGRLGMVTIATNMAGRGTDIILGGNPDYLVNDILRAKGIDPDEATDEQRDQYLPEIKKQCDEEHVEVVKAGGLAVIGTERHDSRRIDNQLRGRSGRQGDPGLSQFYLSLEDDLMRLFGGDRMDRISTMMERANVPDDMPIKAGIVSKVVENAQHKVEAMNFASRKYVLDYDDVMNKQREVIYAERQKVLDGKDIHDHVNTAIRETIERAVQDFCGEDLKAAKKEEWDQEGLVRWFRDFSGLTKRPAQKAIDDAKDPSEIVDGYYDLSHKEYKKKEAVLGEQNMRDLERQVMLRVLDTRWMQHLQEMDYLKEGIGLRAMGAKDPVVEYKNEGYNLFIELVHSIDEDYIKTLLHLNIVMENVPAPAPSYLQDADYSAPDEESVFAGVAESATAEMGGLSSAALNRAAGYKTKTQHTTSDDPYAGVGRNDPCPCGSGKKFKKCHGANVVTPAK